MKYTKEEIANGYSIEEYQRRLSDIERKSKQAEAATGGQSENEQLRLSLAIETIFVLRDFLADYLAPLELDRDTPYRFDMYYKGSGNDFIWFGESLAMYPHDIVSLFAQTQMATIAVAIQRNNFNTMRASPMQFICNDVAYRFEVYKPDLED